MKGHNTILCICLCGLVWPCMGLFLVARRVWVAGGCEDQGIRRPDECNGLLNQTIRTVVLDGKNEKPEKLKAKTTPCHRTRTETKLAPHRTRESNLGSGRTWSGAPQILIRSCRRHACGQKQKPWPILGQAFAKRCAHLRSKPKATIENKPPQASKSSTFWRGFANDEPPHGPFSLLRGNNGQAKC